MSMDPNLLGNQILLLDIVFLQELLRAKIFLKWRMKPQGKGSELDSLVQFLISHWSLESQVKSLTHVQWLFRRKYLQNDKNLRNLAS